MKNVLLVSINARYSHSSLALRYLRESLPEECARTVICEYTINMTAQSILSDIYERNPDVVAISVYIWNAQKTREILSDIKTLLPQIQLILGGPEVSFSAHKWLKDFSAIDCIIIHAGETAFRHLSMNGFCANQKILHVENPHFDDIAFPYRECDMIDLSDRLVYYESSRGCAFSCSYCLSSAGCTKVQHRSMGKVRKELDFLAGFNIRTVKFVDRTFNDDNERACAIAEHISSLDTKTQFHLELHPQLITEDFISAIEKAPDGRFRFETGFQSANPQTLKEIRRPQNSKKSAETIARLASLKKFHVHADLIAGLPLEDINSFKQSFDMLFSARPDHIQLGFLKLLPGTKLHEKADDYGYKSFSNPPYEIISSSTMSYDDLQHLHRVEEILEALWNSGKFKHTMRLLLSAKTPFDLFADIAAFAKEVNFDFATRDWKKLGKLVIDFGGRDGFSRQHIIDCLRFDSFTDTQSRGYPDFLLGNYIALKKCGITTLHSIAKEKGALPVEVRDFGRVIFFKSESENFVAEDYEKGKIAGRLDDVFFTL